MRITVEDAGEYFANRLHAEAWAQASMADKRRALTTAEAQVTALLASADNRPPSEHWRMAVCEQALWLLELTAGDLERACAMVQGVTSRRAGDAAETYNEQKATRHSGGLTFAPMVLAVLSRYVSRRTGALR
jgi:hypothetical protein